MRSFFLFLIVTALLNGAPPAAVYLLWTHDPAHTMEVHWVTREQDSEVAIYYQEKGEVYWKKATGELRLAQGITVHRVSLEGLKGGADYQFRVGPHSKVYRFQTVPEEAKELLFAVGGDAFFDEDLFRKMNRQIARHNPAFVVVGGDVAYARSIKVAFGGEGARWLQFFKAWEKDMVDSEGRLIPIVAVVGNHDVHGKKKLAGQLFYEVFTFPERTKAYYTLKFGALLQLILLDTGHSHPIDGAQSRWLGDVVADPQAPLWKMATYHIGAFPTWYAYGGHTPALIRKAWIPLFERGGVVCAFENHNHAYKRTHPIKGGKIESAGIVYFGDGSWGVSPRAPKRDLWYIDKAACVNSYHLVRVGKERAEVTPLTIEGEEIQPAWVKELREP